MSVDEVSGRLATVSTSAVSANTKHAKYARRCRLKDRVSGKVQQLK